jgi:hypothetical protein
MSTRERKLDTRRKIQFGGLVIKAGLDNEDLAVVLGVLTAAARVLKGPNGEQSRQGWRELGDKAFSGE